MTAALTGIKILECGDGVALGYCGALFAACGADVIKIEAPDGGDQVRRLPPFAEAVPAVESSGLHAFLSANKRSITVDIETEAGVQLAQHLAEKADIVLQALGPVRAETCGLHHRVLQKQKPGLTVTTLSWFGDTGGRRNWAGSDAVAQALAGFLYPIGPKEGPPMIPGGYAAQVNAGVAAFIATMTALLGALRTGKGAYIDQAITEAKLVYTETGGVRNAYDGHESERLGVNQFQPTYPQTIYPAADGWIGVTALTPAQWQGCCELIDARDLGTDPRFLNAKVRSDNADLLDPLLIPLFRKRRAREWFHAGQAARVPLALIPTMADLENLDHFSARDVLARYEHPDLGTFRAATIPWKLSKTPLKQGGVAPRLGEHTHEVLLQNLGMTADEVDALHKDGVIALPMGHVA